MSDTEVASNFEAAMAQVRLGREVVIEHDHKPIAVLRTAEVPRRTLAEVLALMPVDEDAAVMDDDFARDVLEGIEARRAPLDSSKWD